MNPPRIRGGYPISFNGKQVGSTATYACDRGFTLSSSPTAICRRTGAWSPLPVCSPTPVRPRSAKNKSKNATTTEMRFEATTTKAITTKLAPAQ